MSPSNPSHPSNILLDPYTELSQAISSNSFGLHPNSHVLQDSVFPRTASEAEEIRKQSLKLGNTDPRVIARGVLALLDEGKEVGVVLDQRGYTIEYIKNSSSLSQNEVSTTYESLETLLIAISPAYVVAMTKEVGKRFEQGMGNGETINPGGGIDWGPPKAAWKEEGDDGDDGGGR